MTFNLFKLSLQASIFHINVNLRHHEKKSCQNIYRKVYSRTKDLLNNAIYHQPLL